MNINRNETNAPSDASAIQSICKKNETVKRTTPSEPEKIPDNDAAIANIQHPVRGEIAKIQQDIHDTNAAVSSAQNLIKLCEQLGQISGDIDPGDNTETKISDLPRNEEHADKQFFRKESQLLKKIKETIERIRSSSHEKEISTEESMLSKRLRETLERILSNNTKRKFLMDESQGSAKVREAIEKMISSEWSLAGIREIISQFSTTLQFDIKAIQSVESNMKAQNMDLEIGAFSLCRIMEKAHEALLGQANIDSDAAAGLLGLLNKQNANKENMEI